MSYVVNLLIRKKKEYKKLLNFINRQLEDGNVFRSQFEVDCALKSKAHYEEILSDIAQKTMILERSVDNE